MVRRDDSSKLGRRASGPKACSSDFAEQFEASFPTLWTIAVGIVRDPALADDVLQDAAIVALGKLDKYQPGSNFTAWMAQMVRFVALNQSRKSRRHRSLCADPDIIGGTSSEGGEAVARDCGVASDPRYAAIDRHLLAVLDDVGDVARACLLLRTLDGLEYQEIARLLDIPEGTAMSHVHRTKRLLREQLAGWESSMGGGRMKNR